MRNPNSRRNLCSEWHSTGSITADTTASFESIINMKTRALCEGATLPAAGGLHLLENGILDTSDTETLEWMSCLSRIQVSDLRTMLF